MPGAHIGCIELAHSALMLKTPVSTMDRQQCVFDGPSTLHFMSHASRPFNKSAGEDPPDLVLSSRMHRHGNTFLHITGPDCNTFRNLEKVQILASVDSFSLAESF